MRSPRVFPSQRLWTDVQGLRTTVESQTHTLRQYVNLYLNTEEGHGGRVTLMYNWYVVPSG